MTIPVAQQLFFEVAEAKEQIGDAVISRNHLNKITSIRTTPQLDNKVTLELASHALYSVTKHLRPENCN